MRIHAIPVLLGLALAARADTLVLKSGLELHGAVTEKGDTVELALDGETRSFDRSRVAEIRRGESAYEAFSRQAAALDAADAAGWYRLALWAREKRVPREKEALERVLEADPDHRAARRDLGYERVGDAWLKAEEAKRSKGFVLAGGKWMLPAEADRLMRDGLMEQAPVTEQHRRLAEEIVAALMDDDPGVRAAAGELIRELPDGALVRPFRKLLFAPHKETRILAIKTLGGIGDRTALPWLISSSMFDADETVRAAAFRSIKGFEDADVFFPYARALFSKNPKVSIMAAKALADLGDLRGVNVILRKVSIGIGEAGRANIFVGKQQSYIQDFDVEIAQAAAIGDPIVSSIRDGIILDYKILGGYGEAYIVERASAYASALRDLTGRDYGQDWKAYAKLSEERGYPNVALK